MFGLPCIWRGAGSVVKFPAFQVPTWTELWTFLASSIPVLAGEFRITSLNGSEQLQQGMGTNPLLL